MESWKEKAGESLRGWLLVSNGGLLDPNFRQTVVLIGEHTAEGAAGVVLNRPSTVEVADAAPALASLVPTGSPLYLGGPVEPSSPVVLAEFVVPEMADVLVFGSIGFLVGDQAMDVRGDVLRARVYAGYAGWGAGQLEAELAENAWILEPAREEDVFTEDPETLWRRVLERKGGEYERIARIPFDPRVN